MEVFLPLQGISIVDSVTDEGPQPFWWPEADRALFDAIKRHIRPDIPVHELDVNINAPAFAQATTDALLKDARPGIVGVSAPLWSPRCGGGTA